MSGIDDHRYDDLTDDELADLAEQALEAERKARAALHDHDQALALRHLRALVSDLVNDSRNELADVPSVAANATKRDDL
jgi:hypothetical protein